MTPSREGAVLTLWCIKQQWLIQEVTHVCQLCFTSVKINPQVSYTAFSLVAGIFHLLDHFSFCTNHRLLVGDLGRNAFHKHPIAWEGI